VIVDGFDLDSPLVCEGIVGDGCGGGRIFYVEDENLYAYDPYVRESLLLRKGIKNALAIEKNGCIITIVFKDESLSLDLSTLT